MDKINELVAWIQSIELSQVINLIICIVAIIFTVIISPFISLLIAKIFGWKKTRKELKNGVVYNALKYFLMATGILWSIRILGLNEEISNFVDKLYRISIVWIIAKTASDIFSNGKLLTSKFKDKANDPMINIINKAIKVVLYILAAYLTLKEFNYDLGGILTGLGLSTAIIALAAQDTFKDVFSGLAIFWDKPFAIGDWVEIGDVSGTVENITFRSTKLRTTEDTIITLQNSAISSQNIVNWGVIKKRIYKANIKLPLETEEVTVEKVLNRIRFILKYNKDIIKNSVSVHFNEIKDDGININIYLETNITAYGEYQDFCNKINLTLLNILETQGIKLAYPGQNIYIKSDVEGNVITKTKAQLDNENQMQLEKNNNQEKHIKPVKIKDKTESKKNS